MEWSFVDTVFSERVTLVVTLLDFYSGSPLFEYHPELRLTKLQGRICSRDGPREIKIWRPLSVTNLGLDSSSLFLFRIIIENTKQLFLILEKQMSK
jgi:hypothetical protein